MRSVTLASLLFVLLFKTAIAAPRGEPLWTDFYNEAERDALARAITTNQSSVFASGSAGDGKLVVRGYDARTGTVLWSSSFRQSDHRDVAEAIAADSSRVYTSAFTFYLDERVDWLVRAYDAKTGSVLWSTSTDFQGGDDRPAHEAFVLSGNRLFVGGFAGEPNGGTLYPAMRAYNAETGAITWQTTLQTPGETFALAIEKDTLVALMQLRTDGGEEYLAVRAMNSETGATLWETAALDEAGLAQPDSIAIDGKLVFTSGYIALPSGVRVWAIRALDLATGAVVWDDRFGAGAFSTFAGKLGVQNGLVVVAGAIGSDFDPSIAFDIVVRAYDSRTGSLAWERRFNSAPGDIHRPADLIISGNWVYIAGSNRDQTDNNNAFLQALDLKSGASAWQDSYDRAGSFDLYTSLAVAGNRLFAAGGATNSDHDLDFLVRGFRAR